METDAHQSDLGEWHTAQRPADPRLRAYVHGYFASSSTLRAAVSERHLPSIEVPLLINFGEPHRQLGTADARTWTSRDGAWIVGLHNRHQLTQAVGERHFMVVRFTPIGAHLFLGVPLHSIANEAVDIELIDRSLARVLISRTAGAQNWAGRFDAVESLIAERVVATSVPPSIGSAWRKLVAADGRIALSSLTAEMDCSHRLLISRFRTYVGFPPKTIARLLRFNYAVRTLDQLSNVRSTDPAGKPYVETLQSDAPRVGAIQWADLAADCGYFDQAHFINEFREFAGNTPAAFLRNVSSLR